MAKTKTFTRESVLEKAIPLFLRKGYADTSIQDLEQATGIGKSSLYSEFDNKEKLFLACMDHFAEFRSSRSFLVNKPYGWSNIESFLSYVSTFERKAENGCLLIYSMREHNSLSEELRSQNEIHLEEIRQLLIKNISAEKTLAKPDAIASVVMRFFAGAALLQNVPHLEKTDRPQTVKVLMTLLRSL